MSGNRFQQFFNPNNRVFRGLSKITDVVGLSLLWILCAIPVVTIGPASAALYYSLRMGVVREENGAFACFFRSFRRNLKEGVLAMLIVLVLGILLYFGSSTMTLLAETYGGQFVVYQTAYRILLLLPMGIACWIFPILSRYELTLGQLFVRSLLVSVRFLPRTIVLGMLLQETVILCITIFPLVLAAPALNTLVSSLFIESAFRRLTPDEGDHGSLES